MSVAATVYSYCIALFVPNMISTDPKVIGKFTVVSEFEYPHCLFRTNSNPLYRSTFGIIGAITVVTVGFYLSI